MNNYKNILVNTKSGVCSISLNKSKKLNALSSLALKEITKACNDVAKNKKIKMNKSIAENLDLAELINQKLSNRNINKQKSIKKLQFEMLDSQKNEKYISESEIEELKKQL